MKSPYIGIAKNAFGKLENWKIGKLENYVCNKQFFNSSPYKGIAKNAFIKLECYRHAKQFFNFSIFQFFNSFPYISIVKNALVALILLTANSAFAQTEKKNTFNEEVDIVKPYKPKLSDAVKIDVVPLQENITTEKPEISYKTPAFIFNTSPFKAKLAAPSIGKTKLDELHHNYAKLMFGNYAAINGEFIYNTLRNRNSLFTLQGKHHSGNGPVDDSRFSENMLDVFGKRIFSGHSITGNLGYKRNANHFYGQIPGDTLAETENKKQVFNDIYFDTRFAKISSDTGKFSYGANLGIYNFSDLYKTGETGFEIGAQGIEPFRGSRIHVDANYKYWKYKITDSATNRGLLKIGAGYNFNTNGFRADVGFNTASDDKFRFFPNARLEADVIEKYLTLYGGITGNVQENTFRNFAYENPFISSDIELKNTVEKLNLFGGAKGSFSNNSTFGAGVAYKNFKYLPLYLNDSTEKSRFDVLYDSNTTVFNLHAEAGISVMENFNLGAAVNFNTYNLSGFAKAYHRPNFDAIITGKYTIANKIALGADLFFMGKRYGATWEKDTTSGKYIISETSLGNIIDLNANISYAFGNIKGLKAHLALKNILGTEYQLWNFYPSRGFQITGGLSYSFL